MASCDFTWNFKCPQFVDFTTDNFDTVGEQEDVFFGPTSPGLKNNKGVYAKIKASSVNDLPAKSRPPLTSNITDSQKRAIKFNKSKRLSKSDGHLPRLQKHKLTSGSSVQSLNKKSIAGSAVKPSHKTTNPMTPMCLRRTMFNNKKPLKSTEELEMEKIAELQEKMRQHLRFNEKALQRQKAKPELKIPNTAFKKKNNQFAKPLMKLEPTLAKEIKNGQVLTKKIDTCRKTCFQKPVIISTASQVKKKPEALPFPVPSLPARKTIFNDFVLPTGNTLGGSTKALKPKNEQVLANRNKFHTGLKFCTSKDISSLKSLKKDIEDIRKIAISTVMTFDSVKAKSGQVNQISACTSKFGKENVLCR